MISGTQDPLHVASTSLASAELATSTSVPLPPLPAKDALRSWFTGLRRSKPLDAHCLQLLGCLQSTQSTGQSLAIGMTSCHSGDGVSSIAANVAICAARTGKYPVLLVDTNGDRPAVAKRFGLKSSPGWFDAASARNYVSNCYQSTQVKNLYALPVGSHRASAGHVVDLHTVTRLIELLKQQFPLIIVDLPPIATHAGCTSVASTLDGVVLVIEAEKVRGQVARRACEQLARAKVAVLGVVVNKRRQHVPEWLYRRL